MDRDAGVEQREFFRIRSQVGLRLERLGRERWEAEERAILGNRAKPFEPVDAELARWLDRIERKLDRVLEQLGAEGASVREPRDVVISGSGLSFDDRMSLVRGDRLLIELELPATPTVRIRCLGRVVRVDAAEGARQAAVAFEVIREIDRDHIIEHTLAVERNRVRTRGGSAAA